MTSELLALDRDELRQLETVDEDRGATMRLSVFDVPIGAEVGVRPKSENCGLCLDIRFRYPPPFEKDRPLQRFEEGATGISVHTREMRGIIQQLRAEARADVDCSVSDLFESIVEYVRNRTPRPRANARLNQELVLRILTDENIGIKKHLDHLNAPSPPPTKPD